MNKATNFSYFLPRHVFNSIETRELYPVQIRPSDPELTVDKAMTMLNIAEDQLINIQKAEPFNPADFGFTEKEIGGESDFDSAAIYTHPEIPYWISPGDKAMTWEITKLQESEDPSEGLPVHITEYEITAFIPNKIAGAIILQSLGIIELVNPEGVYTTAASEQTPKPLDNQSEIWTSLREPVLVFAPQAFTDPKEQDAFLIDNGVISKEGNAQVRRAMFLVPEALDAMRQIRFLINERDVNKEEFEKVVEAIDTHPNFTDSQKDKMRSEWESKQTEPIDLVGNDQSEASQALVSETAPTE